jgi:hypothetical protein
VTFRIEMMMMMMMGVVLRWRIYLLCPLYLRHHPMYLSHHHHHHHHHGDLWPSLPETVMGNRLRRDRNYLVNQSINPRG